MAACRAGLRPGALLWGCCSDPAVVLLCQHGLQRGVRRITAKNGDHRILFLLPHLTGASATLHGHGAQCFSFLENSGVLLQLSGSTASALLAAPMLPGCAGLEILPPASAWGSPALLTPGPSGTAACTALRSAGTWPWCTVPGSTGLGAGAQPCSLCPASGHRLHPVHSLNLH